MTELAGRRDWRAYEAAAGWRCNVRGALHRRAADGFRAHDRRCCGGEDRWSRLRDHADRRRGRSGPRCGVSCPARRVPSQLGPSLRRTAVRRLAAEKRRKRPGDAQRHHARRLLGPSCRSVHGTTKGIVSSFFTDVAHDSGLATNVFSSPGSTRMRPDTPPTARRSRAPLVDSHAYPTTGNCTIPNEVDKGPVCRHACSTNSFKKSSRRSSAENGLAKGPTQLYFILLPHSVVTCLPQNDRGQTRLLQQLLLRLSQLHQPRYAERDHLRGHPVLVARHRVRQGLPGRWQRSGAAAQRRRRDQ